MNAISARGLRKTYGAFEAVKAIDFDVPSGVTFGFLGPNGAGKTSTMRMLYGLSPVTAGDLQVLGLDVSRDLRAIKARVGVVPQEPNLDSDMTAIDTLVTAARFFGVTGAAGRSRAKELLATVQLEEKAQTRVIQLSGGMKRRLLIARALVGDPDLLILDEPTVGLDPQSRALLWARIKDLRRAGKTVLLTTHYMDEAERLCDELLLMHQGTVIARGRPADLVAEHVGKEVVEVTLADHDDEARLLKSLDGLTRRHDRIGDDLVLHVANGDAMLEAIVASGVKTTKAGLRRATLEDAFLTLTGRTLVE